MTEEEKGLLLEIDNLYTELLQEPHGKWIGKYLQKPNGYNYCHNAEKLKDKVFELYNKFGPDYLDENTIGAIAHTCGKEVSYVKYHYDLANKHNAAKKRHTEFLDSISEANQQIRLDLFSVFTKTEEVKNSKN